MELYFLEELIGFDPNHQPITTPTPGPKIIVSCSGCSTEVVWLPHQNVRDITKRWNQYHRNQYHSETSK